MKRIHKGCLAIYISSSPDSPNTGKIVRVGKRVGEIEKFDDSGVLWRVNKFITFRREGDNKILHFKLAQEKFLFPIDEDDNKLTQTQDNELETTVNKEKNEENT